MPTDMEIKTNCSKLVKDIDDLSENLKLSLENALAKCIDFILNIVAPGIKNKDSLRESEPEEYWENVRDKLWRKTEQKIEDDLKGLKKQLAIIQNSLGDDKPKIEEIVGVIIQDISELSQQLKQVKKRPKENFLEQIDDLFFFYHDLLFRCCTLQQLLKHQRNPEQYFEPFQGEMGPLFHVYSIVFEDRSQAIKACVDRLCGGDGSEAEEKIDFVSLHREVLMVLDEKCVKYFDPAWLGFYNTHVLLHREPIMPPETAFFSQQEQQNFIAQVWGESKKILSKDDLSFAELTGHVATKILAANINKEAKKASLIALAELDREYFKSSLLTNYFFHVLCVNGIVKREQYHNFYQLANEKGAIELIREIKKQRDKQKGVIRVYVNNLELEAAQNLLGLCSNFEDLHKVDERVAELILAPETANIFTSDQSAFLKSLEQAEPNRSRKRKREQKKDEEEYKSEAEDSEWEMDESSDSDEEVLPPAAKKQRIDQVEAEGSESDSDSTVADSYSDVEEVLLSLPTQFFTRNAMSREQPSPIGSGRAPIPFGKGGLRPKGY
jgi:hypothetical protein